MRAIQLLRVSALLSFIAASAFAAPPAEIVIHGRTVASDGTPVTGTRAYVVTFHDAPAAGNVIGAPLNGTVDLSSEGLFDIAIAPPAAVLSGGDVWYSLGIDTDEPADNDASDDVFDQRVQLRSVPFALQAQEVVAVDADQIANGSVDNAEFQRIDGLTGNAQAQFNANATSLAAKADAANVYTKAEIDTSQGLQDTAIAGKADAANVYTKAEVDTSQGLQDTAIAGKADAANVYTKAEIDTSQGLQDTAIAGKADATDVYTKSAADTAFVDAAGDTMSGLLTLSAGLATDNIASASGNLSIAAVDAASGSNGNGGDITLAPGAGDGVGAPGGVIVAAGALPPGSTTDRLYNVGGNLFFNGTQLDAAGVGASVDSSEITDDTIVDADINSAANIAASKLASGVVVAGEGVAQLSNDAGYLTTVSSSDIVNGTIVNADINAAAAIDASKLQSTVMVEGENLSLLNNDSGYLSSEADTLTSVTGRGASTSTQLTLGGGMKIDTISENTSANGVSIDSVLLKDGFVQLPSGSAPSPTTNRLYNEGGTLKFNGTSLGGSSAASEVWLDATGLVSLAEYVATNAGHGTNVLANVAFPRYIQFFNHPTTKVIQEIKVKTIRYIAFDPSITLTVVFEIRDVLTGALAHTVTTSSTDLVTISNAAWVTLPISGTTSNLTITDTEFLSARLEKTGASTTGAMDLFFAVTVTDGP